MMHVPKGLTFIVSQHVTFSCVALSMQIVYRQYVWLNDVDEDERSDVIDDSDDTSNDIYFDDASGDSNQ